MQIINVSLDEIRTKTAARAIAGNLGNPSKMPGKSYGIPASMCKTGSKLRKVKGSTCSGCYACDGNYQFSNVQRALKLRAESIKDPLWVPAMVKLIGNEKHFRWHDSGDIQDADHLRKIVAVAHALPRTSFWLPTRERKMIKEYLREHGSFPVNLTVRLSATMIDGKPIKVDGIQTSSVHDRKGPIGFECRAPYQDNECKTVAHAGIQALRMSHTGNIDISFARLSGAPKLGPFSGEAKA